MAGIDDVLERLVTDAAFARQLRDDPRSALAAYELSNADLALLASRVDGDTGADHRVEPRTSRSALFSLFSQIGDTASTQPGGGSGWQPVDSDHDGLSDTYEAKTGTDPLDFDTDDDGLPDGDEGWAGTDPLNPDSDGDGLTDLEELPMLGDADGDGATNFDEWVHGTDPHDPDTDDDGIPDGRDQGR